MPVDDRAFGRPDHDGVGQHGKVDRHHDRASGRAERDPPDAAGRDQPAAFGRHQLADEPHVGRVAVTGRHVRAPAEQRGRRGPQRRGELPERGRGRPGWVPLQVLQVAQAQPGARRHLRLAQVQFGPSLRDPPAQIAGVGRGRPPVVVVAGLRPGHGVNAHRDRGAVRAPLHLLGYVSMPGGDAALTSPTLSWAKPGRQCPPPCLSGTFVHRAPPQPTAGDGPVSQGPPALAPAERRGHAGHSDD